MSPTLSAACSPLTLTNKEGKEFKYRMSPLTDRDIDELDLWVQSELLELARKTLPSDSTDAERQEILRAALLEAQTASWHNGTGAAIMRTAHGRAHMLWQCLKREHPKVREGDLRPLMRIAANVEKFYGTLGNLNHIKAADVGQKEEEESNEDSRPTDADESAATATEINQN